VAIAATIMYLAFTLMHYKFKGSTRDTACGNQNPTEARKSEPEHWNTFTAESSMESSSATSSNSELEKRASPKLRVLPLNNFILSLTYYPQQAAKQMGGHSSYTSLTYLSSFSRTMFQFFGFHSLTKK
jgi:hypothetical protein